MQKVLYQRKNRSQEPSPAAIDGYIKIVLTINNKKAFLSNSRVWIRKHLQRTNLKHGNIVQRKHPKEKSLDMEFGACYENPLN